MYKLIGTVPRAWRAYKMLPTRLLPALALACQLYSASHSHAPILFQALLGRLLRLRAGTLQHCMRESYRCRPRIGRENSYLID